MKVGDRVRIASDGEPDSSPWYEGVIVGGPDEAGNWFVRWDDAHKDSWEMLQDEDVC
jgi:hypothetical protein